MPKRNLVWLTALVVAALVTLLLTRTPTRQVINSPVPFDPVTDAYRTIQERYFYSLEDNPLRRRAIEAMVSQLDEYSTYIPPAKCEAFNHRLAGLAWGLGLKVEVSPADAVVVGPLAGSPAQNAGLLPGDHIALIDGHPVAGLSQSAVEYLLDAPAPAIAELMVVRPTGERDVVRCRRVRFPLETVQGLYRGADGSWRYLLDPNGLAYVRVREVLPTTPEHLRATLRQLPRLRAVVLDLRGNPGGDLQAAVELANMFIPEGPLVTVEDRNGRTEHAALPAHLAVPETVRVVALVDYQTASAAEMIAGALAYRDRAVLVGCRTRGKGCIQSLIPLGGGLGQINLTTAEFYVDPQRPIQRRRDANAARNANLPRASRTAADEANAAETWGVAPHVTVEMPANLCPVLASLRTKAEVVHPPRPASRPATSPVLDEEPGDLLPRLDPQLKRAIALAASPKDMDEILRQAARSRAATRPAAGRGKPGAD